MLSLYDFKKFVPLNSIKLSEKPEIDEFSAQEIQIYKRFYGLENIPIFKESIIELLKKPIDELFLNNSLIRNKIKLIIHVHTISILSTHSNSIARQIQNIYELFNARVFSVTYEKCVSVLRALEISSNFLNEFDDDSMALIISGEKSFSSGHRLLPGISIIGDASTAAFVKKNGARNKLLACKTKTYGQYALGNWMNADESLDFSSKFTSMMCSTIYDLLNEFSLNFSHIKLIVPHNVNIVCWKNIAKKLDIPLDLFYLKNIAKTSHCYNSDLFINLSDIENEKILQPGDLYLIATVGVGAVFGAALFQH